MQHIRVSFSNGEVYEILSSVIADNRGKHFADEEFGEQGDPPSAEWTTVFEAERDIALNDGEELVDWAENNTNWADLVADATLVPIPTPDDFTEADREKEWDEGTIDVIEWD